MIIDELNKKISDIENLANDKTGSLESKVNDLTDGILMVADAVDTIPELVDEKIAVVTKEITAVKDAVKKVKTIKGDKGEQGIPGLDGLNGKDGKDGSSDTAEQIATKLNTLDKVLDWKVLKDFDSLVNQNDLKSAIQTLENQTRFLVQSNANKSGGASIVGGVESLNALTGAVTLSAGQNISLGEIGNNIEINANFTQSGKYMISGGITWSGTGLTYDVSFLNYFFNGNKTANPTQVTLDASDPTDNRFDAIVVDEAGTVTTITGTPSANPEVPAIPEDQLQVTIILVAAGSTTPTIASEEIYMDDPTTDWTFSTYQTATPTGSINFAGTSSPKQGTECIEASTDARLGARFVRGTSFDAFQYTMLQVWIRFTGTAVASNKALNIRFENSAGTLVGSTVNLFSYGLQRGVLNTWQLVVVPITAFGALPATVKGLKMIMAGGTVGVVRQWDIDYMILTNGSVPYANVPTIAFYKDDIGIASQSGINLIEGTGVTIDAVNNPLYNRVDYTINSSGGGTPAGSDTQIQYNNAGAFGADSGFTRDVATGNTNISATYSGNLFKQQINSNIESLGYKGSAMTFSDGSGNTGFRGLYIETAKGDIYVADNITLSDGTIVENKIDIGSTVSVTSAYNGTSFLTGISAIASDYINIYNDVGAGNELGFFVESGTLLLGNRTGGNNTKITIDDVNESIELNVGGSTYQASDIPKSIKVSVSSAEILSLNTTPKELIPAPGAGKYIDIISAQFSLTYGTTDYSYSPSPNDVTLTYGTNQCSGRIALGSSSSILNTIPLSGTYDIVTNTAINFYCSTGNPTNGDSTVDIYITYKVVTL